MWNLFFIIGLCPALLGCERNPTEPVRPLIVSTERVSYGVDEPIVFRLHNATAGTAYFYHCNYRIGFSVEQKVNGAWVERWHRLGCLAIYVSGTLSVGSNSVVWDTLSIENPGLHRLKFPFGWRPDWRQDEEGDWIDLSLCHWVVSKEFVVR